MRPHTPGCNVNFTIMPPARGDQIEEILAYVHFDADQFDLPPIPEVPEAELEGAAPTPLLDSRWDFAEQCRRLIESKRYTNGNE